MNWYKKSQQRLYGYKVVGLKDEKAFSLYDKSEIGLSKGTVYSFGGKGGFLGTTKKFAIDHYSGLTDEEELLLVYEFQPEDIVSGRTDEEGEVSVRRAKLINIEQTNMNWQT